MWEHRDSAQERAQQQPLRGGPHLVLPYSLSLAMYIEPRLKLSTSKQRKCAYLCGILLIDVSTSLVGGQKVAYLR